MQESCSKMPSLLKTDKWLLVECENGGRNVVSIGSVVNPNNNDLISGDVLTLSLHGKYVTARLMASARDRDLLNSMLSARDTEQQAGPSTEPDEEAEEDYSPSASSWQPSDDDEESDDSIKVENNKVKLEQCKHQNSYRSKSKKIITPMHRANPVIPKNMQRSKTKATIDRKRTDYSTVDQYNINKSLSDTNRRNNPQNAYDVAPQNALKTNATINRKRTHDSTEDQPKINKSLPDSNRSNNPQNACDVTPQNASNVTPQIASKTKAKMNRKRTHDSTEDQSKINKSLIDSNRRNNPQNAYDITPKTASITKAAMDRKKIHDSTIDQSKINKYLPDSNKKNNPQNTCDDTPQNASNITPQGTGNQIVTVEIGQFIKMKDDFELLHSNIKCLKKILEISTKYNQSSKEHRIPKPVKAKEEQNENANENGNVNENDNEEFNRSGDTVLITNKYTTVKKIPKKVPAVGEWVPIGSGKTLIHKDKFKRIKWKSYTIATRTMLLAVFKRRTLATHSLTGKRSPAFQNKPAKMCLDPKIVSDIIIEIMDRFNVKESYVRSVITTKCADEYKMWKTRISKKKAENNENMPPSNNNVEMNNTVESNNKGEYNNNAKSNNNNAKPKTKSHNDDESNIDTKSNNDDESNNDDGSNNNAQSNNDAK